MCKENFEKCNCKSHNCVKHSKKIERPIPEIQNIWLDQNNSTSSQTVTFTDKLFPTGSTADSTFV